jgi:tetraacyldisaccharide 4'-kinase
VEKIRTVSPAALVLLDDGFQRVDILAAANVVVLNVDKNPRDGFCLPLGELREPYSALRRAEFAVLVGEREAGYWQEWRSVLSSLDYPGETHEVYREYEGFFEDEEPVSLEGARPLAFCAIADSRAIRQAIESRGGSILATFKDHHRYEETEIDRLVAQRANTSHGILVTTYNDCFKVESQFRRRGESLLSLRLSYQIPTTLPHQIEDRLQVFSGQRV